MTGSACSALDIIIVLGVALWVGSSRGGRLQVAPFSGPGPRLADFALLDVGLGKHFLGSSAFNGKRSFNAGHNYSSGSSNGR